MHRGYIKLWRKTIDSGLLANPNACTLFLYFLIRANREDGNSVKGCSVVSVKKGQLITSLDRITRDTGLTHRNARTSLKFLEKLQIVTRKVTHQYTIVTFVNWRLYQGRDTQADTLPDTEATQKRHSGDTLGDTLQEEEKLLRSKEVKKIDKRKLSQKEVQQNEVISTIRNLSASEKLKEALVEFAGHRVDIKSPMTSLAVKKLLSALSKKVRTDDERVELIDRAIRSGWKGVVFSADGWNVGNQNQTTTGNHFADMLLETLETNGEKEN